MSLKIYLTSFKRHRWYEVIIILIPNKYKYSQDTLEIGVQRSLVLPT